MRLLLTGLALACLLVGNATAADPDPFAKYDGKEPLPEGLRKAYVAFAKQAKLIERMDPFVLPHSSIVVTSEPRPEKSRDYGRDVNLPFLKNHFSADVRTVRKDPDDCYLIRTDTTAIWFVETKSGAWKIYSYLDKPIQ